eukprot:NODE_2272_length_954_cov_21.046409_g1872_i0.p4 GENE.NODE_2272_length_954_cov_21.046409_g1872_i0~~NODE_2272_length_954_cov_21.046409_g1872_i0.p4  ORF type:complete len:81 (+),score=14.26 NODE_2272_length_954_cov_21.046409_g1872_i0:642-884(+)
MWVDLYLQRHVTDAGLLGLARNCPNLQYLHHEFEGKSTGPDVLQALSEGCPRLQYLYLSTTHRLTEQQRAALPYLSAGKL